MKICQHSTNKQTAGSRYQTSTPTNKEEKDINDALEYLAKQNKTFKDVPASTKAKDGDQVTMDYLGKIDGVAFEGGAAKDANLILGSKSFIDNFEDQLIGLKKGDKKVITVRFPENYQSADLADKEATFDVEIKLVSQPSESKIDDDVTDWRGGSCQNV